MRVSICTPIYNVEKYIEKCSISLFEQTYENIEYIFVNDCSSDNSIKILKETLKRYPNRINQVHIINHTHNRGLAAARNTAIENASGDYILWVDSDDFIDKKTIEILVKKSGSNPDIIFFRSAYYYTRTIKYSPIIKNADKEYLIKSMFLRKIPVNIWGKLIKTSLYKENRILVKEGVNMGEDFQTLPRLIYFAEKILFCNDILYFYNKTNETSYTNKYSIKKSKQNWESIEILESFFADKAPEYNYYLQVSKLKQIAWDSIGYAKYKEDLSYFTQKRKMIKNINRYLWKYVETVYIPILLFNNTKFLIFYINLFSKIKKLILK